MKSVLCLLIILQCFFLFPQKPAYAASIKLNKTSINLARYHTYSLKVSGTAKKIKWSSENESVATVSKKGVVTAENEGSTVIYAKIGSKKLTCKVHVVEYKPVEELAAYGYAAANMLFTKDNQLKISEMRTSTFMEGTDFSYFVCTYRNQDGKKKQAYFYVYPKSPKSLRQINMNTKRYGNLVIQIDNMPMEQMMLDRSTKLSSSRVKNAYQIFKKTETLKLKKGSDFKENHRWLKL